MEFSHPACFSFKFNGNAVLVYLFQKGLRELFHNSCNPLCLTCAEYYTNINKSVQHFSGLDGDSKMKSLNYSRSVLK